MNLRAFVALSDYFVLTQPTAPGLIAAQVATNGEGMDNTAVDRAEVAYIHYQVRQIMSNALAKAAK